MRTANARASALRPANELLLFNGDGHEREMRARSLPLYPILRRTLALNQVKKTKYIRARASMRTLFAETLSAISAMRFLAQA